MLPLWCLHANIHHLYISMVLLCLSYAQGIFLYLGSSRLLLVNMLVFVETFQSASMPVVLKKKTATLQALYSADVVPNNYNNHINMRAKNLWHFPWRAGSKHCATCSSKHNLKSLSLIYFVLCLAVNCCLPCNGLCAITWYLVCFHSTSCWTNDYRTYILIPENI